MASAIRFGPLGARALRSCHSTALKRQYTPFMFLGPASQAVRSRRHASQLFPDPASSDKVQPKNDVRTTNIDSERALKSTKCVDDPQREAENTSTSTSKYKVLFNSKRIFIFDTQGGKAKARRSDFSLIWLRDNCRCSKCVNQETMQKSFNIFAAPRPIALTRATFDEAGVRLTWAPDQHESFYDWSFFEHYLHNSLRKRPVNRHTWGFEIKENPPTVGFAEVMNTDSGVAKMTDAILRYGFVFVDDTPFDDAIHTKHLLERIGPIRETHYGGFYDFIPDMAKADTAYTNIALPAHTDTTYFTDPAGLQAFHLLSHTPAPDTPEATGGESLLVDGFHAAEVLRSESESSFRELARTKLSWHASGNKGITITTEELFPVIEVEALSDADRQIRKVRWNNDDRGVLPLKTSHRQTVKWYDAAAKWDEILRSKDSEYWFQLKPGRALIFDNHRVLHGRSAFTGLRRICGGYINMDDFMSRWRNSNLSQEEVVAQVVG